MTRQLNEDISFCELDDRLYFLDIGKDRYFQLSEPLERGFRDQLRRPGIEGPANGMLAEHGLLPGMTDIPHSEPASAFDAPTQSLLERPRVPRPIPLRMRCDVFLAVARMRWHLQTQRLKTVLGNLNRYRQARARPLPSNDATIPQELTEAAEAFNRLRLHVPIETCCLLDSLSMVRFLAKRGLHAHLVMGVACDPFSAHAWVQHGTLVLNDTVGSARAHTPIKVI